VDEIDADKSGQELGDAAREKSNDSSMDRWRESLLAKVAVINSSVTSIRT